MKSQLWLFDPRPHLPTVVDLVEKAFDLSEASNTPVMIEYRIRACHMHGRFVARDNRRPEFSRRRVLEELDFDHLLERIVTPALAGPLEPVTATAWLKDGCAAALADDQGKGLDAILDQGPPTRTFTASQSPAAATPPVTA
jgi:TPP-dependent indolepyruvate ferredoxin oxidoreductase alpha subunit